MKIECSKQLQSVQFKIKINNMHLSKSQKLVKQNKQNSQQHNFIKAVPILVKNNSHQQQLEELLTCHICYCIAKNLMMCPHCSKIYCEPCIKKSLFIKQQCPHCRKHVKDIKYMANCSRFVNEIKGILEQVLKQKQKQNFRCLQHDVPLNYYCLECEKSVCCQCKMFGYHKQHTLIQVQKKFEQKYKKSRQQLTLLKVFIKEKQDLILNVEKQLQNSQKMQEKQLGQISKMQKNYNEKFHQQSQNQKSLIKNNLNRLQNILQQLNDSKKKLKSDYQKLKKDHKYNLSQQRRHDIKQMFEQKENQLVKIKNSVVNKISPISNIIPNYTYQTFIIDSFSIKQKQKKCIIYSDPINILNCEWKLKIYPNGSQSIEGKFLSIYILMVSKDNSKTKMKNPYSQKNSLNIYEYSIEIIKDQAQSKAQSKVTQAKNSNQTKNSKQEKNNYNNQTSFQHQTAKKTFLRQYASAFEPGQSWGYNKYIELSQLYKQNYVQPLNGDRLIIKYGIRRPDYHAEYKCLQQQLEKVQKQIFQEQKQLEIISSSQQQNQTLFQKEKEN